MSPSRTRGKPLFDPEALNQDLDELWPARPRAAAAPTPPPVSPQPADTAVSAEPAHSDPRLASASVIEPVLASAPATESASATTPATTSPEQPTKPRQTTTGRPSTRTRPPEVLLSAEVYDELYRTQIAEKKVRRGLARTMGAIVLDAIETHATKLATTWTTQRYAVGEGQLFERPSSHAVPRRRRHATAPRTVVLSGVTAANGQRLDNLVEAWAAGTRSALVEQALRYEFGLIPD
ncbi:hypothetical protein DQP57_17655 [Mycobacterium colombiense]|uniref:Uncharacterized protein n=1 Tax=Mycobacterium colombiense TaxID=339268 RepID=A0A329LKB2_9MYCO|nr:hypothetical protein DQP57_17655 [Mycobacterium colombiense]